MSVPLPDTSSLGVGTRDEDPSGGGAVDEPPPEAPPSRLHLGDRVFAWVVRSFGVTILATPALMFLALLVASVASLRRTGLGFLVSSRWDPVHEQFGALPFIYGTVVSSILALVL